MYSIKLVAYIGLLIGVTIAQDYDEYQQAPRAPPARLRSGNGIVDQQRPAPTPVPILKQINRHNEDGSYTYGYEGADGSFKIETKLATGEVKGKYGYVDETGKVRVVEYGANKYGFQPSGEGITVAPPTLVDETTNKDGLLLDYEDEPQPQRQVIARVNRPQPQPRPAPVRPIARPAPAPRPQYNDYDEPISRPQYTSQPGPAPPRIQIPGAAPSDVVYSERPRPARPDAGYTQTQTFSVQPQQSVRVSQPVFQSAPSARTQSFNTPNLLKFAEPQQVPQPVAYNPPSPPKGRSTSVLDQLAKDYALPQGGSQALHDISFGYY